MYIRIQTISSDPAREQQITRVIEDKLIPALQQIPGFQSYTGGYDRATGRGVGIAFWRDMEHAQNLRTALGSIVAELTALGVVYDPAQVYEVTAQA